MKNFFLCKAPVSGFPSLNASNSLRRTTCLAVTPRQWEDKNQRENPLQGQTEALENFFWLIWWKTAEPFRDSWLSLCTVILSIVLGSLLPDKPPVGWLQQQSLINQASKLSTEIHNLPGSARKIKIRLSCRCKHICSIHWATGKKESP